MPIISLQRRIAEKGRIRLGQKVPTSSGRVRPDKLDRFRFTSADQALIEQIGATYGGQARAWDNAGKAEFEVITDARSIPVIVVKGGFSQWHETWSKAGLAHRCDGEKDPAGVYCDPADPAHVEAVAKPTTRLSVMLSEIETLGVWRLETHGWNAAAELPSMAELAMHVGDLVPATLSLAERSSIVEGPRGQQTSRFVVPVLDLLVTKRRLMEIAGMSGGMAAVSLAPAAAPTAIEAERVQLVPSTAIEAAPAPYGPAVEVDDITDDIADASTLDELRTVWGRVAASRRMTSELDALLRSRAAELQADAAAEVDGRDETADPRDDPSTGPAGRAAVDAGDVDGAWMGLVAKAGAVGWTDGQLREALMVEYGQPVEDLDAGQLAAFAAGIGAQGVAL